MTPENETFAEEARFVQQASEYTRLMLDSLPLGCALWDVERTVMDCNRAAVELLGAKDRRDLADRLFDYLPERQPDGRLTSDILTGLLNRAFGGEGSRSECELRRSDGDPIPAELTLSRVIYGGRHVVVGYLRDLREHKRMAYETERKNRLLHAVNGMAAMMLQSGAVNFEQNLRRSMGILAGTADVDRMYVWKNYKRDGLLYCSQICEWCGEAESQQDYALALETGYREVVPGWEERLSSGGSINGVVRDMSVNEQAALSPQGILSVLIVPIMLEGEFWGFVGFDDCRTERIFSQNEELILRSASELIAGALSQTRLEHSLSRLETEVDKIYYDPLTGIYNRRFFDENMQRLLQSMSRSGSEISMLMVDIDHFKTYNDLYGHLEGDRCLRIVADTLHSSITRADDFVARYGGEEFAVVLPNTDANGARLVARKLLNRVRGRGLHHKKDSGENCVTVSIGVTTGRVNFTCDVSDFVRRADEMLYESKRSGRDRYTFSEM